MASLIMWEVTGSSLTVAVSIKEISGSKDIAATTESSGCFWCIMSSCLSESQIGRSFR